MASPSLNLVGYLSSQKGLGQVARGYLRALASLGVAVREFDLAHLVESGREAPKFDLTQSELINLAVFNPIEKTLVDRELGAAFMGRAYNIGAWWWELPGRPPAAWKNAERYFDELWVGSDFVRDSFERHFTLPLKVVPPVVDLESGISADRSRFGIAPSEYVFLFLCDFKSIPERKNPVGLARAFKRAFSRKQSVRLVIKISNAGDYPEYYGRLAEECADAQITLLTTELCREDNYTLIASCDCYASLHRAEGFGLPLAEAMLLGKPVIGTAWSGNTDFMTAANSLPVNYSLVELECDHGPYLRGQTWAEPDLDSAVEQMRRAFAGRQEMRALGERAVRTITEKYSLQAVAEAMRQPLRELLPVARVLARAHEHGRIQTDRSPDRSSSPSDARADQMSPGGRLIPISTVSNTTVSVCLPVLNGERFLAEAIESVLSQSFSDFELLISDDCSEDGSLGIIERFAARDARIRFWRNEERLGLFANYNRCIERSSGKYIKPFAQDDLLHPDFLEEGLRVFERHPSVVLFNADRTYINELGVAGPSPSGPGAETIRCDTVLAADDVVRLCLCPLNNPIGEPCTVMFPATAVGRGFDSEFAHLGDLEYWIRLLDRGDFYRRGAALCKFRQHVRSTTSLNMQCLFFATDAMKMGRKLEKVAARLGISSLQFMEAVLPILALHSSYLNEKDLIAGIEYLESGDGDGLSREFYELSFRALRMVASYVAPERMAWERAVSEVKRLEGEVRLLLNSKSWRMTKPLRDAKRFLDSNSKRGGEESIAESVSLVEMERYCAHLQDLRRSILESRSWTVTSPLREIGLF